MRAWSRPPLISSHCSCLSSWPQSFFLARNRSHSAQELSCQDGFSPHPCPAPALYCHTENSSPKAPSCPCWQSWGRQHQGIVPFPRGKCLHGMRQLSVGKLRLCEQELLPQAPVLRFSIVPQPRVRLTDRTPHCAHRASTPCSCLGLGARGKPRPRPHPVCPPAPSAPPPCSGSCRASGSSCRRSGS